MSLSTEESPQRRWLVEALLLTDESLEGIARKSGLSVEVVEAYHQLFYCVRPYLGATDWIMVNAVTACCGQSFVGQPLGPLWRYAGFTGGTRVLEVIVAVTRNQPLPAWVRDSFASAERPAYEVERIRVQAQLVVAALTTPPGATLKAVIEAHGRLRRMDRRMGRTQDVEPSLVPVMESFLCSVAGRGKRKPRTAGSRPRAGKQAVRLSSNTRANPETLIASLREALK